MNEAAEPASFRDPSGFVFHRHGSLYRQVNDSYRPHFEHLSSSGLYEELVSAGLLVAHEERPLAEAARPGAYRVLAPQRVPFVSYPYEWSFGQLREAALLTLGIQSRALRRGMILKDASAFNVQFVGTRPVFIDTLSFEIYREGEPWVAYRQFCQHFLAPLFLVADVDVRLGRLSALHLDGVPLDLAASLLPWRSRLRASRLLHIHLHARSLRKHAPTEGGEPPRPVLRPDRLRALVDSLAGTVERLAPSLPRSEWDDYESEHRYGASLDVKERAVEELLRVVGPRSVWDLGGNAGRFSRVAARSGAYTLCVDADATVIHHAYAALRSTGEERILPLVVDLTNPTPGLGWAGREREPLDGRGTPDLVLSLALIHHLAIGENLPLGDIAEWLTRLAPWLVLEWVPKTDPQVRRLLSSRRDIFPDYRVETFERDFGRRYRIEDRRPIEGTERVLYLMRRREAGA